MNRVNATAGKGDTIIPYGGSLVTSPDVKAAMDAAIADRIDHLVSNDTLGGDPWYGVDKSYVVWYYIGGKLGEVARFAREGERLHFSD